MLTSYKLSEDEITEMRHLTTVEGSWGNFAYNGIVIEFE